MCQRCGRNLLVDRIFRMRYPQAAPYLGFVMGEIQNVIGVIIQQGRQPGFEQFGLLRVTTVTDRLYAATNFTDGDDAEVQRIALRLGVREEAPNARVCLAALAYFADSGIITVVITPERAMYTLKLTQIGNSVGVVLPKEALAQLKLEKGDTVFLTDAPGGFRLTSFDPAFEAQMTAARTIMKRRRNVLRELAK